jgi:hypothetical protein
MICSWQKFVQELKTKADQVREYRASQRLALTDSHKATLKALENMQKECVLRHREACAKDQSEFVDLITSYPKTNAKETFELLQIIEETITKMQISLDKSNVYFD